MKKQLCSVIALLSLCGAFARGAVTLDVDATDAPKRLIRTKLHIPAKEGTLTLLYPKWIPGEHGPTGPLVDLVGMKFSAGDKTLTWQRDPVEMYRVTVDVPAGAEAIDASLEYFLPAGEGPHGGGSVTDNLVCLNWNEVLLYPADVKASDIGYEATLKLPRGWKFGTALPIAQQNESDVKFRTVSLETLIDSPLIAGEFFRHIELTPGQTPPHYMEVVADSAAALELKPETIAKFSRLVAETGMLFGARHYREYHFLVTLSDHIGFAGLEHHQSSDNRLDEKEMTDEENLKLHGDLLPHEMTHSWNGKYRRPADIATPDYQQPMKTELLWVYEGLTEYLGEVLTARAGIRDTKQAMEGLAFDAADLNVGTGRTWRPLSDTAVAAQILYHSGRAGHSRRRAVDFYREGTLIWLDADVTIRQETNGKKSLDDFCKLFHGGESGAPEVVPYTFDQLCDALNQVAENDWKQFFRERVYSVQPHAPFGGIENGGWKVSFVEERPDMLKGFEAAEEFTDAAFSLGISVGKEGKLGDVIADSPADKAGLAPGAKLVAINGRKWSPELLRAAIKKAKTDRAPIELLCDHDDFFKTYSIDYHDGEKYPVLVRDESKPDILSQVLHSLTPPPTTTTAPAKEK